MSGLSVLIGLAILSLCASKYSQAARCFANFGADKYPTCALLSPNVSLHWAVRDGTITWAVDVDGVWDWVGVGISEGGMLGADLAVAVHDSHAGQWTALDYWSTAFDTPELDKQQDVSLVSVGRESRSGSEQGSTLVVLRRPLVSCDAGGQDQPILNDTRQNVVYAYGKGLFGYHGELNRGESGVVFVPNITSGTAASGSGDVAISDMPTFEMRMPAVTLSTSNTTRLCVNLALPDTSNKFHIYRYEPIIEAASPVSRIVAYACGSGSQPPPTPVRLPYPCWGMGARMECVEVYMFWGPGVDRVDAPAAAALAFGPATGITYMTLQVQYNVEGTTGQTDSSGLRMYYSSTLKQYDMGVLTLGSYGITVSSNVSSWTTPANVCPGNCTTALQANANSANSNSSSLLGGGLVLVDSFYHMQRLGQSAITRHVRGSTELPPLGVREHFDVDYQAPVGITPGTRQLLPGDLLITSCTFKGPDGGDQAAGSLPAKDEEMCFNTLTYYPNNPNITECIAVPSLNVASCTTSAELYDSLPDRSAVNVTAAMAAAVKTLQEKGAAVSLPANLSYTPYQPKCVRTAPPTAAGSAVVPDEDEQAAESRHRRNVGGAVAAILIVTLGGGVAIFFVYRAMRRRRQLEEEQNLFEKYNPNSIVLPITVGGSSAVFPPSPTAAAAAGQQANSGGSTAPPSAGPNGGSNNAFSSALAAVRGYSAVPTASAV